VELMMSRVIIPTKSCQSGGFPCRNTSKNFSQSTVSYLAAISTHGLR
jgi:hypothetical protein